MARAPAEELTAKLASLAVWTKQAQGERNILSNQVCNLEGDAAMRQAQLGIVARAVRSLKDDAGAGEACANKVGVRTRETLGKKSELHLLAEGLALSGGGECARVADLNDIMMSKVRSVITAALFESGGAVSDALTIWRIYSLCTWSILYL